MDRARAWRASLASRRTDLLLAGGLTALAQGELAFIGTDTRTAAVLSLVITGSLLFRRSAPIRTAATAAVTYGLQVPLLDPAPQVLGNALAAIVALYSAAALSGLKKSLFPLGLLTVAFVAFEADQGNAVQAIGDDVFVLAAWGFGGFVWRRRGEVDARLAEAEEDVRSADLRTDTVLAQERRRIARELHDVVSHAVTVIVLQARGGRAMLDSSPEDTRRALDAIEVSGTDALAEMRRLVHVLREPDPDTAPQPGLREVPALLGTFAPSTDAHVATHGAPRPLAPGTDLTAFRCVQEGLTNAARHAPGVPVSVDIDYGDSTLTIRVRNTRPTAPGGPAGSERGLLGLRERVGLYGGTVSAGATDDGGWELAAVLPYADSGFTATRFDLPAAPMTQAAE